MLLQINKNLIKTVCLLTYCFVNSSFIKTVKRILTRKEGTIHNDIKLSYRIKQIY